MDIGTVSNINKGRSKITDDDLADKLSHWYTPLLISFFLIVISVYQAIAVPLKCWTRKEFSSAWTEYAESYCWIQNTYYVPHNESIPDSVERRDHQELGYYQWVPFVLAIVAFIFYCPRIVWRNLNYKTGINISSLMKLAVTYNKLDNKDRDNTVKLLAYNLEDALQAKPVSLLTDLKHCLWCMCGGRRITSYLTVSYMFTKLLYVINAIGQFYLLNSFLGTSYSFYGFEILQDIGQGKEWPESGHFPRITLCDFSVRALGQPQSYTLQCVLVANLLNERVFIFLWFWLVFVTVVSSISLLQWLVFLALPMSKQYYIQRYLKNTSSYNEKRRMFESFYNTKIGNDGVLLIHMIANNGGDLVATQLVRQMWDNFIEENKPNTDNVHV